VLKARPDLVLKPLNGKSLVPPAKLPVAHFSDLGLADTSLITHEQFHDNNALWSDQEHRALLELAKSPRYEPN